MKSNSLAGLLTVIFVTLKLVGSIAWSWWYVLLPAYGAIGINILVLAGMFIHGSLTLRKKVEAAGLNYEQFRKEVKTGPKKSEWKPRMEEAQARQNQVKK